MRKLNILSVLSLGLTVVVLLLTNWGFKLSEEKNRIYQENQTLSEQVKALDNLKEDLQEEVDTLMNAYGQAIKENELLEKLLNDTARKLTSNTTNFKQFRMESQTTIQSLKQSMLRLIRAKSTLEITLQEKTRTNDVLLEQAGIDRTTFKTIMKVAGTQEMVFQELQKEFAVVQEKRAEFARTTKRLLIKANQRLFNARSKQVSATDFRVETEMKNGKVTAKAKRVRKIIVSFDLNEVPDDFLGEQELYLVIKNTKRELLKKNAEIVKVRLKGLLQDIKVVEKRAIVLELSQRIPFQFELTDRLEAGYHKVEVYSKDGLLGETSFRVEK